MFSTVRYFIKTSIIFLITGIATGLYISVNKDMLHNGFSPELVSAHAHIILVGSVMMMIMGVALWFFPRPGKEDKKYKPGLIMITYWTMTLSTAFRFLSQAGLSFTYREWLGDLISIFSFFQIAAIILFFYSIWGRIRPVGSKIREEKGERF